MTNVFKILGVALLGFFLVSCDTQTGVYDNRYPNETVYRAPDGGVYRRGDVYRDRNGYSYRNGAVIGRTNDIYGRNGNVYNRRNLPPGQAKKVYGGRAKDYAPGQVKKRNDNYYNDRYDKKYKKNKKNKHHRHDD